MPAEHRQEVFRQLLARMPKPAAVQIGTATGKGKTVTNLQEVAQKKRGPAAGIAGGAIAPRDAGPRAENGASKQAPKPAAGQLQIGELPTETFVNEGGIRNVAPRIKQDVSDHFYSQIVPQLAEKHDDVNVQDEMRKFAGDGIGSLIGAQIHKWGQSEDRENKLSAAQNEMVLPVYRAVLGDIENWEPGQTYVDKKTKEERPLTFGHSSVAPSAIMSTS